MIFLDSAPFISEAIESVLAQTFSDWELILVDDGSTDRSSDIARTFHKQRPDQIRYVEHEGHANLGTAASRNLGLNIARGEFVAFLDADDLYLPRRLEAHMRIVREMPDLGLVQSDHVRWHTWGSGDRTGSLYLPRFQPTLGNSILRPHHALVAFLAVPQLLPGICDITVRRTLALGVGGFEGRFRVLYEDQSFVSKLYLEQPVYLLQTIHAVYRRHDSSSTARADLRSVRHAWKSDLEALGDVYREWFHEYVENCSIEVRSKDLVLSALDQPTNDGLTLVRRMVKRTAWLLRRASLKLGAANAYQWMLVREHRVSIRFAQAQYRKLTANLQ